MKKHALLLAVVATAAAAFAQNTLTDSWIDSPEAYFATPGERREWTSLRSEEEKSAFRDRYWLRRDPSPETPKNEFREAVMGRIAKADAKYKLEKMRGSQTARGFIFIVFGPPARFTASNVPPGTAPRGVAAGSMYNPQGLDEVGESFEHWVYEKDRTPKVLEAVGRPNLAFDFVIKPNRGRDELQSPGIAYELRDKLAQMSIVSELPSAPASAVAPIAPVALDAAVPESLTSALDSAPPPSFASPAGTFGHAALLSGPDAPSVTIWFASSPEGRIPSGSRLIGRIRTASGNSAGSFAQVMRESAGLTSSLGGHVYGARLRLDPGDYVAAVAVVASDGEPVVAAQLPIHVANASGFDVSSLVLSTAPSRAQGGPFDVGNVSLAPRADGTFSRSENLWYAAEVSNPADLAGVSGQVTVRSGSRIVGTHKVSITQQPVGPNRYLIAQELPLGSLEPGDYSIYLTLKDANGTSQLRRADFRVTP